MKGLASLVCLEILYTPFFRVRNGVYRISRHTNDANPFILLISLAFKPNFPNTSSVQREGNDFFPELIFATLGKVVLRDLLLLVRFVQGEEIDTRGWHRVNLLNLGNRLESNVRLVLVLNRDQHTLGFDADSADLFSSASCSSDPSSGAYPPYPVSGPA
jgi:hypothetical protein